MTLQFLLKREEFSLEELVFIDESGININMSREYGYSPKGKRLFDTKPYIFAKNYTVLGALSMDGLDALMTVQGGTTLEVFFQYAEQILIPTLEVGQVVVLDNLAAHKNQRVVELFGDYGIHLLNTPPYSPEWNPIEMAWSKVKTFLRAYAARSFEELEKALVFASDLITPQEAKNYIQHCGYMASIS